MDSLLQSCHLLAYSCFTENKLLACGYAMHMHHTLVVLCIEFTNANLIIISLIPITNLTIGASLLNMNNNKRKKTQKTGEAREQVFSHYLGMAHTCNKKP